MIMGFVKSHEELASFGAGTADFYDAEMLTIYWETKPEIVERLLPPPLKPVERPLVIAFVANYPRTSFGPGYREGALFLRAEFEGEEGSYCLAMPVTGDLAMAAGREKFGFPKKLANIHFDHDDDRVEGWLERHGVRFFEVRAKLDGKPNAEDFQNIFVGMFGSPETGAISYNFKHFLSPDGTGFDYNPRLVRQETMLRPTAMRWGAAEVVLQPSDYDPWFEVEVVRMLGATFTVGNNSMLNGSVVAEADSTAFAPYAFLKWDW
jgi:acetoacetate decarboxylase